MGQQGANYPLTEAQAQAIAEYVVDMVRDDRLIGVICWVWKPILDCYVDTTNEPNWMISHAGMIRANRNIGCDIHYRRSQSFPEDSADAREGQRGLVLYERGVTWPLDG